MSAYELSWLICSMVPILQEPDAGINVCDGHGMTPMNWCCKAGNVTYGNACGPADARRCLCVPVCACSAFFCLTVLFLSMTKILIAAGASVNPVDEENGPPLLDACFKCDLLSDSRCAATAVMRLWLDDLVTVRVWRAPGATWRSRSFWLPRGPMPASPRAFWGTLRSTAVLTVCNWRS